jgi:signal transduction histidine kinase
MENDMDGTQGVFPRQGQVDAQLALASRLREASIARTATSIETSRAHVISSLERTNRELVERLEELEERYQAVERFAGTVAHQLAEPLVIAESAAILVSEDLGEALDPLQRDRLDAIGRSAARARRLMDALLADARAADRPLELRPLEVGPVLEETLAALSLQIEERRASIVIAPMPVVLSEAGLLAVILENLISNALKYGPRSGGIVTVSADERPDGWLLSVAGEGMPIPQEDIARIFQPFQRAQGERRVPGVGLGLNICTRLVKRLGGDIGVQPGAASGNTFWVRLPASD